ncbi:MAG: AlpA family phage regulatory protein [Rhodomicrobium sp.]
MCRILRFRDLSFKGIAMRRQHVDKLCREGKFPANIKYAKGRIGWRESDIDAWLEKKPAFARAQIWPYTAGTFALVAEKVRYQARQPGTATAICWRLTATVQRSYPKGCARSFESHLAHGLVLWTGPARPFKAEAAHSGCLPKGLLLGAERLYVAVPSEPLRALSLQQNAFLFLFSPGP